MKARKTTLPPTADNTLKILGENIRLARKRRLLTAMLVARRAGIARSTLQLIEKGEASVAMSSYLHVLLILGFEKDLLKVAADDPIGRKLQDAELLKALKFLSSTTVSHF